MRASLMRLAKPAVKPTKANISPLTSAPANLLPPIPLYRRLLRAHRTKLGPEERLLGDQYIKAEFRAHKNIDNPLHIVGFLQEWQLYAQQLEGGDWKDGKLDREKIDRMSDEQIGQLWELMKAIQGNEEEEEEDGSSSPQPKS